MYTWVCAVAKWNRLINSCNTRIAKHYGCNGVICGHIHTAEDKMLDDIHYLNSGDWVESLTAIVEHRDGRLSLIDYTTFKNLLAEAKAAQKASSATPVEEELEFQKLSLPKTLLTSERLMKAP